MEMRFGREWGGIMIRRVQRGDVMLCGVTQLRWYPENSSENFFFVSDNSIIWPPAFVVGSAFAHFFIAVFILFTFLFLLRCAPKSKLKYRTPRRRTRNTNRKSIKQESTRNSLELVFITHNSMCALAFCVYKFIFPWCRRMCSQDCSWDKQFTGFSNGAECVSVESRQLAWIFLWTGKTNARCAVRRRARKWKIYRSHKQVY